MKKIITTSAMSAIMMVAPFFSVLGADYGVKSSDVEAMKNIQNQLTSQYINATQHSAALQKTEEKMLDSKIEGLMLEDSIAEYDSDISTVEKQMIPLFEQLHEPKQKIAEKEEKKTNIRTALEKQGKILSSLYLEMLFHAETNTKATVTSAFLASVFASTADTTAETITEESLKKMEQKTLQIYVALLKEFKTLDQEQDEIASAIAPLQQKYDELSLKKDKLLQQKAIKEELLVLAREKKEHYEDILQESKNQIFASMEDAMSSDDTLMQLQKKLDILETQKKEQEAKQTAQRMIDIQLKDEYSPEELTAEMVAAISKKVLDEAKGSFFFSTWPVKPSNGISATFQDADYKKRFKMQHNAIDIPAPQGSAIVAPADGYVYKTVDNGMGYSYIILLHRNNVRTVYGHVSGFAVQKGTMVSAGEVIGYVGGTPGTRGAGKMTTGPHLHFEVLVNEVYKNPINYLPAMK